MPPDVPTTVITYDDGYGCTAQRFGTAWRGSCGTYPDGWIDGGVVSGTTVLLWSLVIVLALYLVLRRYQRVVRRTDLTRRPH